VRSRDPQPPGRRRFSTTRQPRRRQLRVFLSYRREDASGHAGRLYDLLAARYGAERVFMDIDAIPLGSEFANDQPGRGVVRRPHRAHGPRLAARDGL
jgi:hypothetical protein